jgi:hypothetical protein
LLAFFSTEKSKLAFFNVPLLSVSWDDHADTHVKQENNMTYAQNDCYSYSG